LNAVADRRRKNGPFEVSSTGPLNHESREGDDQRMTRAPFPFIAALTSSRRTMEVSPASAASDHVHNTMPPVDGGRPAR